MDPELQAFLAKLLASPDALRTQQQQLPGLAKLAQSSISPAPAGSGFQRGEFQTPLSEMTSLAVPAFLGGPGRGVVGSIGKVSKAVAKKAAGKSTPVTPISNAPTKCTTRACLIQRLRDDLLGDQPIAGQDPLEFAEEMGSRVSKKQANRILAEHGVEGGEELQRFRFEVKAGKDGTFNLAKVLGWLGY